MALRKSTRDGGLSLWSDWEAGHLAFHAAWIAPADARCQALLKKFSENRLMEDCLVPWEKGRWLRPSCDARP
ncbi:hypothetical protein GLI01_36080 [Gluconacetobacter liquefaciens]|nr:hypothetical protein GLI01_36080 [Gluconacetobacter liquefaciens]